MGCCNRLTRADMPWPRIMMSFHDHPVFMFIMISSSRLISPFEEGKHAYICTTKTTYSKISNVHNVTSDSSYMTIKYILRIRVHDIDTADSSRVPCTLTAKTITRDEIYCVSLL